MTDKGRVLQPLDVVAHVVDRVDRLSEDVVKIRESIASHKVWFTVLGVLGTMGTSLMTAYLVRLMR